MDQRWIKLKTFPERPVAIRPTFGFISGVTFCETLVAENIIQISRFQSDHVIILSGDPIEEGYDTSTNTAKRDWNSG